MKKRYIPFVFVGVLLFVSMLSLFYLHSFSIDASLTINVEEGAKTMLEEENQLPDVALLKKMLQFIWEAFIPKI